MSELDDATREVAALAFDLAREGGTEQVVADLEAGLGPDLTDTAAGSRRRPACRWSMSCRAVELASWRKWST